MGFFKHRKQKRLQELAEITERYQDVVNLAEAKRDPAQIKQYVGEQCEQMGEAITELDNARKEYEIVTSYLNDIQVLDGISGDEKEKIRDVANNIILLTSTKEGFINTEKKISDAQFSQMGVMEKDIPRAITQMKKNEAYQNMLKRDMDCLEGEKAEWDYEKHRLILEQRTLKTLSFVLIALFGGIFLLLLILSFGFQMDTTMACLILIFLSALGGFGIFIRRQNNSLLIKQSDLNMNQAVTLQNKVKIKFVNITTTVDYMKEKYHVTNAYELNFQWEQYLEICKEREKLARTNEDLDYFNNRLLRSLRGYRLYDSKVWLHQAEALVEPKEMVEVKHNMLVRRQKLRSRIESQIISLKQLRDDMNLLLKDENIYSRELENIVKSIDKICG